ncbi:COX15/CtaA family protein [Simplicispira psychrophila]|uniref:COX15/CtaA family protein n=1 Tax=Simplicispira psychrophila TaxID=80882 RepID=UPI00047F3611|nr:COX15/CtaA family protein [Simplicispira psychrophila]
MAMPQPLYDLTPLLQMLLLGALVALGPLLWVWRRHVGSARQRRWQALTVLTLFLTFDLVLFGAFTRLTDSGLGCPDWPGCYGNASPLGAHAPIAAAQTAMPTGPVTHRKAWVEMVHRYLATGVGALITVLAVMAWRERGRVRKDAAGALPLHPGWATFTLAWVCLQGAFGALTVTMKLFPAIVTLHLVGGLVLLVLLAVQAVRHSQAVQDQQPVVLGRGLRWLLFLAALAVGVQVLLGGWVSTNYAVLACNTFPLCQGSWWPAMDFAQGFEVWRALGMRADGSLLDFSALTAIHYVHRLFAYVVLLWLGLLAWRMHRAALALPSLVGARTLGAQARWLATLALLQLVSGLSNVVLDWPLLAAVLHTGGAAALVLVLTWALGASRSAALVQRSLSATTAPVGAGRISV